mmetsp:Transcript_114587/g.356877  ORF Transcript_114587/g.356877 Transcript_114587/m.356877 type:complete len:110 (+) Transcript_114587:117-446(+)
MSVHHPYYMVDPSLLPAAGVKRTLDGPPSASLAARQERLHKWHVDQQHKGLAKLGLATVSSGKTPRDMGGGAQGRSSCCARAGSAQAKRPTLSGTRNFSASSRVHLQLD